MNPLLTALRATARFLLSPVRFLRDIFSRVYRKSILVNASEAGAVVGQKASGLISQEFDAVSGDVVPVERSEPSLEAAPGGILFRMMAKPQMSEQTASELSLSTAKIYQRRAELFYEDAINIMPPGGLFYEEVERAHVQRALSVNKAIGAQTVAIVSALEEGAAPVEQEVPGERVSVDKRFSDTNEQFREIFNTNSRRLMFYYVPALFSLLLAYLYLFPMALFDSGRTIFDGIVRSELGAVSLGAAEFGPILVAVIVISLVYVLYQWPYRVSQQIIALNVNNYISQKFGRMSQHFQVAKRQALNVERSARIRDAERLKDDAGTWTVSYNWIAMRLMFCELLIRNTLFQIRRNTMLYKLGGVVLCFTLAGGLLMMQALVPSHMFDTGRVPVELWFVEVLSVTLLFVIVIYGLVIRRPFDVVRQSFDERGWHRFNSIRLDSTVAEHVGEDKLQIITFRDRNRME